MSGRTKSWFACGIVLFMISKIGKLIFENFPPVAASSLAVREGCNWKGFDLDCIFKTNIDASKLIELGTRMKAALG